MNAEDLKLGFAGAAAALAALLALFVLFSSSPALAVQTGTENVTIANDTDSIEGEFSWADSATAANNTTADLVIENSSGSVIHTQALSPDPGNTTMASVNVTDAGLSTDTTYTVYVDVTGDSSTPSEYLVSSTISLSPPPSGGGGGLLAGTSNKMLAAGALLVFAVGLILKEGE